MTMNIDLPPQLEEMVRQKVASGRYASASDVVSAALRLMQEQDRLESAAPAQLREEIRAGLQSGDAAIWNPAEAKRQARATRATKADTTKKD
jgi:antitoxin ParD1/3/4